MFKRKGALFRYRAYFEGNPLRFVRARAHVSAQMTQIACAVGMRNAILRNHLKQVLSLTSSIDSVCSNPLEIAIGVLPSLFSENETWSGQ